MNAETATQLLKALRAQQIQKGGEWVRSCCVLAPWTHAKGTDSHPSFGIKTGLKSHYYCFACHKHGSPSDLVLELMHLSKGDTHGMDLKTAFELADEPEPEGYIPVDDWKAAPDHKEVIPWPEVWLNSFPTAYSTGPGKAYLIKRGVDKDVATALGIRYDFKRNTICFPIRNRDGALIGMRGRYLSNDAPQRFHDYSYKGQRNSSLWLNAQRIDLMEPVLIVESSFDLARCYRYYQNVTAPLSAGVTADSLKWLQSAIDVTLFFDNDDAGWDAVKRTRKHLGKFVPVKTIEYPDGTEGEDPGSLPEDILVSLLKLHLPI